MMKSMDFLEGQCQRKREGKWNDVVEKKIHTINTTRNKNTLLAHKLSSNSLSSTQYSSSNWLVCRPQKYPYLLRTEAPNLNDEKYKPLARRLLSLPLLTICSRTTATALGSIKPSEQSEEYDRPPNSDAFSSFYLTTSRIYRNPR